MFGDELDRWIHDASEADLRDWVERLLVSRQTTPFPAAGPLGHAEDVFLSVYRAFDEASVRQKLERAVQYWLSHCLYEPFPPLAVEGLLWLVAHTPVPESYELLVQWGNRRLLKGKRSPRGTELHQYLLRVLAGLPVSRPAVFLFKRDIADPLYAPVCYRALWQRSLRSGMLHLPQMLAHARSDSVKIPLGLLLENYIAAATVERFWALFPAATRLIKDLDSHALLIRTLPETGYHFERRKGFVALREEKTDRTWWVLDTRLDWGFLIALERASVQEVLDAEDDLRQSTGRVPKVAPIFSRLRIIDPIPA